MLGDDARRFNPSVSVVNTGVDLRRYHVRNYQDRDWADPVVIGWIGTPNSYKYIRDLEEVFRALSERYEITLRIVSSMDYTSQSVRVDNRRWSLETEVSDLCTFDIGIMPLPDDEWTRGKSGCKAVQYLAVGVPAVCSPVGITTEIVQDGVNGFLASTPEEWLEKLSVLVGNADMRQRQGLAGRQQVEEKYCIQAVAPQLIRILKSLA
jgi:glycosyltransferase involved in cell wall biosynthesis